ncbi:hypothetical protein [uncultured Anaerovibrio sp.]|uniref:hypothetical protein n=1 Tax=uncultured Anaerovibrio sp. TaxID=361586 RepID=UPI002611D038|nr:hypothetical protein [uncultured Anaerovibrio sp.]
MQNKNNSSSVVSVIVIIAIALCGYVGKVAARDNVPFSVAFQSIFTSEDKQVKEFTRNLDAATKDYVVAFNTFAHKAEDPNLTIGEAAIASKKVYEQVGPTANKLKKVTVPTNVSKDKKGKMEQAKSSYESALMLTNQLYEQGQAVWINGDITERDVLNADVTTNAIVESLDRAHKLMNELNGI